MDAASLCRSSTLTIAWHVGKRDASSAVAVVEDARAARRDAADHDGRLRAHEQAMAARVADHVWSLEELMVLAVEEPVGERPTATPRTIPRPARELPAGRG